MKNIHYIKVPGYASEWAYKYFHQSAYEPPWNFPSKKVLKFLSQFKRKEKIRLFRGINKYNKNTSYIVSWTYNKEIAANYTEDSGKIIEKDFYPDNVLLDTTVLNKEQKELLGYDYKVDDKEVLIIDKQLI